jgi:hypothetical protein
MIKMAIQAFLEPIQRLPFLRRCGSVLMQVHILLATTVLHDYSRTVTDMLTLC